jgi:hypothetical protein
MLPGEARIYIAAASIGAISLSFFQRFFLVFGKRAHAEKGLNVAHFFLIM